MDPRRMCPHCRAFITVKDKICPYCNERVGPRAIDLRSPADLLGGLIPHARFNTIVILLANFGLYVVTALYSIRTGGGGGFSGLDGGTLFNFGAKFGLAIAGGQWWRLVTAGFLHGGLLHILMNSWVLFDLAPQVEEIYGGSRMWVIYFVSSVGGFYLSDLWNPRGLSVGASAALCGLIGAMIALGVTHRSPLGDAIRSTYIRWAIYILIFSLLPGIDMAAHIGGGITGFAVAYLAGTPRYHGAPVERLWQSAALICLGLTGASFALWYLWFSHIS
jgi:rhomboid protease GluP